MRAAIYNGKRNVTLTELPTPKAGDNDIVVKNIYSSICGTDAAVYTQGPNTGHKIEVGSEFGHETISEVVDVGKNVKDIKVSDIVYPYPLLATGDTKRAGTIGGFSEYILIPNAELGKQVYMLSDKIPPKIACLIEPFTVGTRAARRANPQKGENAVVFGCGTIGIAAAIALKYFGCAKVMICDIFDFRLNIAKKLGFEVCNSEKEDLAEVSKNVFGEARSLSGTTADADIYIDAAGAPELIETFQHMGKIGARLVVVAVLAGKRPIDVLSMTYSQHAIIGSGGYMPEDVKDVMRIMESGEWDIGSIITHDFPWEELTAAIETAADAKRSLNVIIHY